MAWENFTQVLFCVRPGRLSVSVPPPMATLKPFSALRPTADLAAKICELPYDVMSSDEARDLAKSNPFSFLHVSKPEIDLEPAADVYSDAVYT